MSSYTEKDIVRFWKHVDKTGECWIWTSTLRTGYGMFSLNRKPVSAHRLSYEIAYGPPGDLFVLHRCDNPPCVRPEHLFAGTHQDNMDDMYDKGRRERAKIKIKKLPEDRKVVKLSRQDILDIEKELENYYWGLSKKLAKKYGVNHSLISHIKTGYDKRTRSISSEN